MRIREVLLAVAALASIVTGAVIQNKKPASLAHALFSVAKAEDFIGKEKCAECHEDQVASWHKSGHATFVEDPKLPLDRKSCEGCHGPGAFHIRDENPQNIAYTKLPPKEISAACLRCHSDLMKESHWKAETHARANVACTSCHQIHPTAEPNAANIGDRNIVKRQVFPAAKESGYLLKADQPTLCNQCHQSAVAQFRQNSHHPIPEGKMLCSDCHQVHESRGGKKQVGGLLKDKCVTCHADVAGPFIFEHDPVAGWTGNGCQECHRAHGSQNPKLLNGFSRGLCGQCHTDKQTTHFPGRTCWSAGCHVAVHGSNSSPRFLSH